MNAADTVSHSSLSFLPSLSCFLPSRYMTGRNVEKDGREGGRKGCVPFFEKNRGKGKGDMFIALLWPACMVVGWMGWG